MNFLLSVLPYSDSKLGRASRRQQGSFECYRASREIAQSTLDHLIITRQIERGEIYQAAPGYFLGRKKIVEWDCNKEDFFDYPLTREAHNERTDPRYV